MARLRGSQLGTCLRSELCHWVTVARCSASSLVDIRDEACDVRMRSLPCGGNRDRTNIECVAWTSLCHGQKVKHCHRYLILLMTAVCFLCAGCQQMLDLERSQHSILPPVDGGGTAYTYTYIHVHVCVCMYIYTCVYIRMYMYIRIY